MNNEIKEIIPIALPFDPNDKIFPIYKNIGEDEEDSEIIGYESYNDKIQNIKNISGVNEELLGPDYG